MVIDKPRIQEKFVDSKKYLKRLQEITNQPVEILQENLELQLQAERVFQIISQIMLDVCTHIIANSEESPPFSYADCMMKLSSLKILTNDEGERFADIIRMRNLIVHQYGIINYTSLHSSLKNLQKDFKLFKDRILLWVEKTNVPNSEKEKKTHR